MTGILLIVRKFFPMKWLLLLIKILFRRQSFQFSWAFRVQSREHAGTMLQKMGTSAPDVDGTLGFSV